MTTRRRLLVALSTAAALAAARVRAQQSAKVWRVGILVAASRFSYRTEFERGMRELGYLDGKNLTSEWRFADGQYERLPALAAELVDKKVDVIVTDSTVATKAAQRATASTPIVMTTVGDPVGSGFAASLARPGGNITGLSLATTDTSSKWLELVKVIVPTASRVAVLSNPGTATAPVHLKNIHAAARALTVTILPVEARSLEEIERAFATMAQARPDAVVAIPDAVLNSHRERIAALAIRHRLPLVGSSRFFAEAGALASYGQNYATHRRRAAAYIDKIFKGAKPAELPIEQPTTFELIINRKTAKAIGQVIPHELMLRVDAVIE